MIHEEVNTEGILRHIFKSEKSCFIPQYIGPKMEMLKLYSMEDYQSLPVTKWNIKQPAADDKREEALSSGTFIIPSHHSPYLNFGCVFTFGFNEKGGEGEKGSLV